MQLKPIDQQVVVVVGASSGIGRETALKFAKRGAKLIIAARSEEGLGTLIQEIAYLGGTASHVTADVTVFEQVQAIADKAIQLYGRLDTWVHVAAVNLYATFEQTTPEEFKRVVDVNLMGQVYGAMVALPHLRREGRGALIHVSSVEAKRAFPYHSAYAAGKHGIDGFLEAMRVELMHEKVPISVTNIMPASINTPLFNKARTKIGVKPQGLPPFYEPEIAADAILYAAEHPTRDLVVGGAGRAMLFLQSLSPGLMDALVSQVGFQLQQTKEPKSEDAPDNLFEPISGYDKVKGDFTKQARTSYSTWFATHPAAKWGAIAAVGVAALALLTAPSLRNNGLF
uniref:SDR family oxidoreductase n=1 Tax=Trichocoleus desertorum TaxID=1481672 RepID=UPI0025B3EB3E|nr:SDR family oxidoreductase [Trichocoleus desertorum]